MKQPPSPSIVSERIELFSGVKDWTVVVPRIFGREGHPFVLKTYLPPRGVFHYSFREAVDILRMVRGKWIGHGAWLGYEPYAVEFNTRPVTTSGRARALYRFYLEEVDLNAEPLPEPYRDEEDED